MSTIEGIMKSYIAIITTIFCMQILADEQVSLPEKDQANQCDKWSLKVGAEYLYWWWKDSPEPVALGITLNPTPETVPTVQPAIGDSGVSVILGGKDVDLGQHQGVRLTAAGMFNDYFGIGAKYLLFPEKSKTKSVSSNGQAGSKSIFIPFNNTSGSEFLEGPFLWAFPDLGKGSLTLKMKNDLQDAEGNLLGRVYCSKPVELMVLAGFKWWNLNDYLNFQTTFQLLDEPDEIYNTEDHFQSRNNFYGGLLGLDATFTWGWFHLETIGKVSLGSMQSTVRINGEFVTNDYSGYSGPASEILPASGLFALITNSGKYERSCFAVIPEGNLNLGFQLMKWLCLDIGYSFMYVNKVIWSGDTMDSSINPDMGNGWTSPSEATFIGPEDPKPQFKRESFWAQGLSVGLGFTY